MWARVRRKLLYDTDKNAKQIMRLQRSLRYGTRAHRARENTIYTNYNGKLSKTWRERLLTEKQKIRTNVFGTQLRTNNAFHVD